MKTLWLLLVFSFTVVAQDLLNNDSIVKMVKGRLQEAIIMKVIETQPGNYSLAVDDLIKLKQQGVSDKILAAMLNKRPAPAPAAAAPAPVAPVRPAAPA